MTDREKLIGLLSECSCIEGYGTDLIEKKADHLLANGVTFAADTNDGGKWVPVSERLPEPFVPVLVQMPGEVPFPTVREGSISRDGIWYSALYHREPDEITHWMPLPEPPKGE